MAAKRRTRSSPRADLIDTGIPHLNAVMGGGLRRGDMILLMGPPGSGKTTLALQLAFSHVRLARSSLYISTYSEAPSRLVRHFRPFSFYDESAVGKRLFFLSIYPLILEGNLQRVRDALAVDVQKHSATLVILDGLMTLYDLCPDVREIRTFLYELGSFMSPLGCNTVITTSQSDPVAGPQYPELTLSDAIVQLGIQDVGSHTRRTLKAWKTRGTSSNLGPHSFRMDDHGINVFPRFESIDVPDEVVPRRERVSLGVGEIDTLMSGGPPAGSVTLLAGVAGTGKTLVCLQFLLEGARHGQKGLLVSFGETAPELFEKARSFRLDLEGSVGEGRVTLLHCAPIDVVADEFAWKMWDAIERGSPERLVIDGVAALEWILAAQGRARGYFVGLMCKLRKRGITSLITREMAPLVEPDLDFSNTPLAVLAENLVLLRDIELGGDLVRVLSVLRMMDSNCDRSIRQYVITGDGLRVLSRVQRAEGALAGISRLRAKHRVRR